MATKLPTVAQRLQDYFRQLEQLIPNPPKDWEKIAKPCRWKKLLEEKSGDDPKGGKPGQ